MSNRIQVVNPVGSPPLRELHTVDTALSTGDVRGTSLRNVVVIENGKPNAGALLNGVARELAADMGLEILETLRKPNPSMAAPADIIESASHADMVLIGTAD